MKNQSLHYMLVPINKHALEIDMDKICNPDSGNFKEWVLTTSEVCVLDSTLFYEFDEKFDIFIDLYEECVLKAEHVNEALNMARNFKLRFFKKELQKSALKKVIEALEYANSINMPIWFWF